MSEKAKVINIVTETEIYPVQASFFPATKEIDPESLDGQVIKNFTDCVAEFMMEKGITIKDLRRIELKEYAPRKRS